MTVAGLVERVAIVFVVVVRSQLVRHTHSLWCYDVVSNFSEEKEKLDISISESGRA